jgi:hypothetical protein
MPAIQKKTAQKGKKKALTFVIDCAKPVDDKIMDIAAFEKFLLDHIKVDGKIGTPLLTAPAPFLANAERTFRIRQARGRACSVRAIWASLYSSRGTAAEADKA